MFFFLSRFFLYRIYIYVLYTSTSRSVGRFRNSITRNYSVRLYGNSIVHVNIYVQYICLRKTTNGALNASSLQTCLSAMAVACICLRSIHCFSTARPNGFIPRNLARQFIIHVRHNIVTRWRGTVETIARRDDG